MNAFIAGKSKVTSVSDAPSSFTSPVDSLATVRGVKFKVKRSNGKIESNWCIQTGAVPRKGTITCSNGEVTKDCPFEDLKNLNPELFKDIVWKPDADDTFEPDALIALNMLRGKNLKIRRSSGAVEFGWTLATPAAQEAAGPAAGRA
jgi:hypothetical protein